ncbi:transglutaminase family protein [Nocardioides jensenii]|uniref:transglutaminase family protein n=1 Tax=Nocardioides jensenii TaxID=1843 RepID=UPI00082D97EB|nr:DUF3488 and transglutaminase-like domain-containing protein [Nocardioides jensenii]
MTGRAHGGVSLPLVMATAATSWLALLAWSGFVQTAGVYLLPLMLGIPLVSAVGVLTRWARFPILIVVASQLLMLLLFANAAYGTSLFPTGGSITAAAQEFANGMEALRTYAAPIPRGVKEVAPVLVLGGMLCHILVDLCAVTLGRVPVAGLPLLVIYTLPVSILDRSVSWLIFVCTVTGFLIMLAVQEGGRIARWGRQFGAPGDADRLVSWGGRDARRHPVALGATATALALFVPLLIPTFNLNLIGGKGPGGSGDREVRITNPMTDLRRDLVQGDDVPLVLVDSRGSTPRYLRLSVLTTFTGEAWTPGNRDLRGDQTTEGKVPRPIGLTDEYETETRDWQVTITDNLKSWWLPAPMYVSDIEAGPNWGYDADILDFYTNDKQKDTAGINYSLTELIPDFSGRQLAAAGTPPGDIETRYAALPDVPREVTDLAKEITEGYPTEFEKVQALQQYFRGGQFEYNTDRVEAGNGNSALLQFLEDKEGYCEQFASAMAVMARSIGIPARVAVGFFEATRLESGVFEFSSKDLHAWPEIYFKGAGWVKFEPTPSTHIDLVPTYSDDLIDDANDPSNSADPSSSAAPTTKPTTAEPTTTPQQDEDGQKDQDDGFSVVPFLWGGGALVLLAGLALTPRAVRRARSSRRWHAGGDPAEIAWAELRDVTVDVGRAWPEGRSPRATGAQIATFFGPAVGADHAVVPRTGAEVNPEAVVSLDALVAALEQSRYAATPVGAGADVVRAHLDRCIAALRGGVGQRARWRAEWLPPSLVSGTTRPGRRAMPSSIGGRRHRTGPVDQIS